MSTSPSTTQTTRPGAPTNRPDPDRWFVADEVTTENAPRTFDTQCRHPLPNTCSEENQATPR